MQLSDRVNRIKPSPTIAIAGKAMELKRAGKDIISLSQGEPDFDTPEHIKQAAIEAIEQGQTKYTAVDGTPALKQAIIDKFQRDNQLTYAPEQILVSSGAKQSCYNMMQALLNAGDEVIIPTPYWVSYPDMAILSEAKPVIVETTAATRFQLSAEQLATAITNKTRCLILNSPSNPSGMAYSKTELAALGEVLKQHPNIIVMSDDIYEEIIWTEEGFHNIVTACPELYDQTVVINGVSKAYAMTGWRIGYAAGPVDLIKAMKKVQSQSTSNPCSISQVAAAVAIGGQQDCIKPMLTAYKERHDYVLERLNQIPGVSCEPGDGTFYSFANVEGLIEKTPDINNDLELGEYLIEKAGLAVVPGTAFGSPGHLRLSFATSLEVLGNALNRLASC